MVINMRSKVYEAPIDKIFEACKHAIYRCKFTINEENKDKGIIIASTHPTIFSWGEEIIIKIETISGMETKVTVESYPKAQLFDWGKSRDNENKIMKYLDDILEEDI